MDGVNQLAKAKKKSIRTVRRWVGRRKRTVAGTPKAIAPLAPGLTSVRVRRFGPPVMLLGPRTSGGLTVVGRSHPSNSSKPSAFTSDLAAAAPNSNAPGGTNFSAINMEG